MLVSPRLPTNGWSEEALAAYTRESEKMLTDPKYAKLYQERLQLMIEERAHALQNLREAAGAPNPNLSTMGRGSFGSVQDFDHEADAYAYLMDLFGREQVAGHYGTRYPERKIVDLFFGH